MSFLWENTKRGATESSYDQLNYAYLTDVITSFFVLIR